MTKPRTTHLTVRWRAAAVALVGASLAVSACSSTTTGSPTRTVTVTSTTSAATTPASSAAPTTSASPSKPAAPKSVIKVSSLEDDGTTWGIGMPIVLYFSALPKTSEFFTKAVTVTVNGKPANGTWYFEQPYAGEPVEAHYRERNYWPAHATIQVKLPIGGVSAGGNSVFSGALSSVTFHIGDKHVSSVNAQTLKMTVTDNDVPVKTIEVSLGKASTPTYNGTKIVMQKGEDIPGTDTLRPNGAVVMTGPGYHELVDWSVRLTASGEYVHYAPWNNGIGATSTSNGCTNVGLNDSTWFYNFSQVGDVVLYTGTNGSQMPSWDGLGDWNLSWGTWTQGGLLRNHGN